MGTLKILKFDVDHDSKQTTQGPFVRIVADGSGCGIPSCGCSGDNYICISDGDTLLSVRLTKKQAAAIREGHYESA